MNNSKVGEMVSWKNCCNSGTRKQGTNLQRLLLDVTYSGLDFYNQPKKKYCKTTLQKNWSCPCELQPHH